MVFWKQVKNIGWEQLVLVELNRVILELWWWRHWVSSILILRLIIADKSILGQAPSSLSSQPNQSLIDGITCLQSLASSNRPVKSRELARELGLNHTRVNRLLRTLKSIDLAVQDQQRSYLPGPGIHVLASLAMNSSPLFRNAMPVIEELLPAPHLVAMGALWRDKVTYLFHAETMHSAASGIASFPVYDAVTSSIGQVLLAEELDESVERRLGSKRFERLLPKLQKIRQNGFNVRLDPDTGEYSIAVPVHRPALAGIAFSQLYDLTEQDVEDHVRHLKSTALRTSGEV